MNFQLTDYGVALFKSLPVPPVLDSYQLGQDFNFLPSPTDTGIHGAEVFSGVPGAPVVVNANIVKYSIYMDTSVGDFSFGNAGLFYQNNLVALGVNSTLVTKIKNGVVQGNSIRLDAYLSEVGVNYDMNADQAESNNRFQVSRLQSADYLPRTADSTPNMYVIQGAINQSSVLAFTDRQALWNFSDYAFGTAAPATVMTASRQSVTIAAADFSQDLVPSYKGEIILQFATGPLYSICRNVVTAIYSGNNVVLGFETQLAALPQVNAGDKVLLFRRNPASTDLSTLPIATASVLGGIKIGAGLIAQPDGTVSIDIGDAAVTSVNGETGDVVVNAGNLPDLAKVGKTNNYNDLDNKPAPYTLPIANSATLGGVKIGAGLAITADGVLSSNGNLPIATATVLGGIKVGSGLSITADGILRAQAATIATTQALGVVKIGSGITVAPDGTISAAAAYTLPVASTSVLGGVKQGTGVTIAGDGTISATPSPYTLPVASASTLGGVKQGTGVTISGDGTLSYVLPIAGTLTLGGVKVGSGLAVTSDGTISVTSSYQLPIATQTVLGGVKIGSGINTTPDGTIFVSPVSDDSKLNRIKGVATALQYAHSNLGTVTGSGQVLDFGVANSQAVQAVAGALSWNFSNAPATGTYGELQLMLRNGGLATHTWPSTLFWVMPDGSFTQDFLLYIGTQRAGATGLQSSGLDFLFFFTVDGGLTIYGKVL